MSERVTTPRPVPASLTDSQQAGLDTRRVDQDRTLASVHRLEAALSTAASGRESSWRADVAAALATLDAVTEEEQRNADQPDSLLSDIARTQPLLRNRVRGVRAGYRQLRERLTALSAEIADSGDDLDVDDVRRRLAWVLTAIRHQRARESDLVYEAYYEAFHRDVEADVGRQP